MLKNIMTLFMIFFKTLEKRAFCNTSAKGIFERFHKKEFPSIDTHSL